MKSILTLACIVGFIFHSMASVTLHCPPDVTVACTAQTSNLNAYGVAHVMKHGVKYSAGLPYVEYGLNSCNVGFIKRKWQAEDENGHLLECFQHIYFRPGTFSELNITWPESDTLVLGCDAAIHPDSLPRAFSKPKWDYLPCSNIAYSFKDRNFDFGPDCIKVLREWTVIDWCQYVPGSSYQGIWKWNQVFKLANTKEPALNCPEEVVVHTLACDSMRVSMPYVSADGAPCTGTYTVVHHSPYADTTGNDASGTYPVGVTEFYYTVDFSCGASKSCLSRVIVEQDLKPVPYCLSSITVALMGVDTNNDGSVDDGMVEVWAKDPNLNSYHPCLEGDLSFSFSSDTEDMVRTFTCEHIGYNTLQMWVTDSQGNQSFCAYNLVIQNNLANIPDCGPDAGSRPLAAGKVMNVMGEPEQDVLVSFTDISASDITVMNTVQPVHKVEFYRTDNEGYYEGYEITPTRDFMVKAYKEGDINQVDQSDISILEAHILSQQPFQNTYTYLAADINEDNIVDSQDLMLLKNLVNSTEDSWPHERQRIFYYKPSLDNMSEQPLDDNLKKHHEVKYLHYGNADKVDFVTILKGDLSFYESM